MKLSWVLPSLGVERFEALRPAMQEAMRRGLMPMINAMAIAGVVSLPGMMTGQILAGVPPAEAVRYQLLIMFLIAGATGLGLLMAVSRWCVAADRPPAPAAPRSVGRGNVVAASQALLVALDWPATLFRPEGPPPHSRLI